MKSGETELDMVERHTAAGEIVIARQHALIAKLKHTGHNLDAALALLDAYTRSQALHRAHLERLRAGHISRSWAIAPIADTTRGRSQTVG